MKLSHHGRRILCGLVVVLAAGLAWWVVAAAKASNLPVVLSDGSYFLIRRVSYGTDNVYWWHPVRRAAAAVLPEVVCDQVLRPFARLFPGPWGVASSVKAADDHLVVFGEFHAVSAANPSFEFTGVDGDGKEGGPLQTNLLVASTAPPGASLCILASGTNVAKRWPIAVRIYERDPQGKRKLLADVPAKRAPK